jgi:hypothetical protein
MAPTALNLSLLVLIGCGGGSSSSSSDSGGNSDGPVIQFSSTKASIVEGVTQVLVLVELDTPGEENIELSYFTTGDAQNFVDFQLLTDPPLTILAGNLTATIVVQIFDDGNGELDETVVLHLVKPANANLGVNTIFTTTIQDDDAIVVNEAEPNDSPAEANVVGNIQPLVSYTILGTTVVGAFDMFELTATEATDVFLFLTPASAVAEIGLCILDAAGNIIAGPFDASGPGDSVFAIYKAAAGEVFYLSVTVIGTGTDYGLDAVGLFSFSPDTDGGPSERTLEARGFGDDFPGLQQWIQAGERTLELRGDLLLDSRTGTRTRLAPIER